MYVFELGRLRLLFQVPTSVGFYNDLGHFSPSTCHQLCFTYGTFLGFIQLSSAAIENPLAMTHFITQSVFFCFTISNLASPLSALFDIKTSLFSSSWAQKVVALLGNKRCLFCCEFISQQQPMQIISSQSVYRSHIRGASHRSNR